MNRLTKKDKNGKYYTVATEMGLYGKDVNPITNWIEDLEERNFGNPIDKLARLEDLEEQLGCPLEKLKTTNVIYSDLENGTMKEFQIIGVNFCEKRIYFWMGFAPFSFDFDDYKKYYWLKKDKSE